MTNKQKKHIHKIAIEPDGTRRMNDEGYWMCECGATIFPNCSWFEAEEQDVLKRDVNYAIQHKFATDNLPLYFE